MGPQLIGVAVAIVAVIGLILVAIIMKFFGLWLRVAL